MQTKKTNYDHYVEETLKQHPKLKYELKEAGVARDLAVQIYNFRQKARLTQKQLAERMGTSQSNVSRMESGDYSSYTIDTLYKVTKALNADFEIKIVPL